MMNASFSNVFSLYSFLFLLSIHTFIHLETTGKQPPAGAENAFCEQALEKC